MGRCTCGHESDQVADVNHADGVVERVVVHHKSRMAGTLEYSHQFAELDVLLDSDDVSARHHNIADTAFAQAENILEHPAFFRSEPGFTGPNCIKNVLQIGACNIRLPSEQRTQRADEPVFAAVARRWHRNWQVSRFV